MELKVVVEDNIYIENENGDQIISIDMDYDMGEVLQELDKLVEYINRS